jgi:hypothetical protein
VSPPWRGGRGKAGPRDAFHSPPPGRTGQAEREEREAAEARAANDREIERKRSQGWPI